MSVKTNGETVAETIGFSGETDQVMHCFSQPKASSSARSHPTFGFLSAQKKP
jgi:hypothetical protein